MTTFTGLQWADAAHTQINATLETGERIILSAVPGLAHYDAILESGAAIQSVDLTAYAADARWQKEVAGITVAGVAVATDDRSKLLIAGARMAADADSNFTTLFAAADGSRTTLTAPQIIAISNAVLAHVAACFAKYDDVASRIDGGTITATAEIDAAFATI